MRFGLYSTSAVTGAAGFVAGFSWHKLRISHQNLTNFAKPTNNAIGSFALKELENHTDLFSSIMKHGIPSYDTLRTRHDYVISYNRKNKIPNWVMEHLTRDMVGGETTASRSKSRFFKDKSIHPYFRASAGDYINSGYDKGHIAAAAHHKYSQTSLDDTFVMSNIAPQNPNFNQRTWLSLERHIKSLIENYGSVYVCSGPLFLPRIFHSAEDACQFFHSDCKKRKKTKRNPVDSQQTKKKYIIYEVIGENNVAVPTHFFKVIVCEDEAGERDMESYVIPNESLDSSIPLKNYMVPRDAIEREAGFLIFQHLSNEIFRTINCESDVQKDSLLDTRIL